MRASRRRQLQREHRPENIARRLAEPPGPQRLSDMVLGGIDGCITTFAIVSGALGAGFSPLVVVAMGLANLLADGISMAVSNYEAVNARLKFAESARRTEEEHIDWVPEGEREEVRQIFARKGFRGKNLEHIVETVTANRSLWIETMLSEEYGLSIAEPNPLSSAWWTFLAFIVVGVIPLLPFLFRTFELSQQFIASSILAALVFFLIGLLKGWTYRSSPLRAGVATLLLGSCAALVAYIIGHIVQQTFGAI